MDVKMKASEKERKRRARENPKRKMSRSIGFLHIL
jgi:hypothetical protein